MVDYSSGTATNTLTFNYTVASGHSSSGLDYVDTASLVLNLGTIQDAALNNAVLTLPAPGSANSLGDNKEIILDIANKDNDGDGILNIDDNCPETANADQADLDSDGIGDVCDDDIDGDGIINEDDNCPTIENVDQKDSDNDGIGDACDPDKDGDGIANANDNCPDTSNADQKDSDGDGIGDVCDSTNPNNLPVANSQYASVTEQVSTPIMLSGFDKDGDPLTYSITYPPRYGNVVLNGSTAVYRSYFDRASSPDSFYFKVNDGKSDGASPAKVSVNIIGTNDAPVSSNISSGTIENTSVTIPLVGSDPDYDPINYKITRLPNNGQLLSLIHI